MIECGTVREFDSDKNVYIVNLDRTGDVISRAIVSGAERPYQILSRVVCVRVVGLDWAIIGEVSQPQPLPGDSRPKTLDETIAEFDSTLRDTRISNRAADLPNFREIGADVLVTGDASLENKTLNPRTRSRVKVFSHGSILSFASNLCFTLWHRLTGLMVTQCRSWILRTIGYEFSVSASVDSPRLVKRTVVQANPLPSQQASNSLPLIDRETIEGFIPSPDDTYAKSASEIAEHPKARRGIRLNQFDYLFVEADNNQQTVRLRLDKIERDDTGKITSRVNQVVKTIGRVRDDGVTFNDGHYETWGDWAEISINATDKIIRIKHVESSQVLEIAAAGITMSRQDQSIVMDDSGVTIKAKNFRVEAVDDIVEIAGKLHLSEGNIVDHKAPG